MRVTSLFVLGASLVCAAPLDLSLGLSVGTAQTGLSLGVARPGQGLLGKVLTGLGEDVSDVGHLLGAVLDDVNALRPQATPTSTLQAMQTIKGIFATPRLYIDAVAELVVNGLSLHQTGANLFSYSAAANSCNNTNTVSPKSPVYTRKMKQDAPYSVPEKALRGAIYMPANFTMGKKPPVILFPPTAVEGGVSYAATLARLLAQYEYADPVWVNVPGNSLDDAQLTAEHAAYAINYIAGITRRNVSIITFSQGSVNTQWALKYWPSTRLVTSNFIPLSGDFGGTAFDMLLCPRFPNLGCTPSILQQRQDSNFIKTLRSDGGDSAYVPTTSIFSISDEVVQPQNQVNGSARLLDARGVGVANVEVQSACGLHPAGLVYTHEGILYNPLAWALVLDVLKNGGPGRLSRLDMTKVCAQIMPPGMGLQDLIQVESLALVTVLNFLTFRPRAFSEPPIKAYALQ